MELVCHDRFRQVPATTRKKTELCKDNVTCSQLISKQKGGQICPPPAHRFPTASPPRRHCRTWHFYNRHISHEKKKDPFPFPKPSLLRLPFQQPDVTTWQCSQLSTRPTPSSFVHPEQGGPAMLPEIKLQRAGNRLDVPVAALEIYIPWTFGIWRNKMALK